MSNLTDFLLGKSSSSWSGLPPSVKSAIQSGDGARDQRDWVTAEMHYMDVLAEDETLTGIWVQLGHMRKEQGRLKEAADAYETAIKTQPDDVDGYQHVAHVYKLLGKQGPAIRNFTAALYLSKKAAHEEHELLSLLRDTAAKKEYGHAEKAIANLATLPPSDEEAGVITTLREIVACSSEPEEAVGDAQAQTAIVFDISDLISFWNNARLPTGIQRVQIEAITAELEKAADRSVHLCCFTSSRDDWLRVPLDIFARLVKLATIDGKTEDPLWQRALSDLHLHLVLSRPFVFPRGAMLVNLGTSWWIQNYFLYVRHAKETRGIRYVPFVHDMIPIMTPEHCTRALTQDFISWVLGVFDYADYFLANSKATRTDLIKVAAQLGREVREQDVAVIPLNCDFRKPDIEELEEDALEDWQIEEGNFVLFVSTIESRKGHMLAFEAWSRLIAQHGADAIPKFVCVGNRGWLNDMIYDRLETDEALSDHVVMLSGLSDAELALLYRSCSFTVYPSTYEGWGLPVTESLCYGKVPLASDAASIPEAGEDFASYFTSGSVEELVIQAERLIFDEGHRASMEDRIAKGYAPRKWSDVAGQIAQELETFLDAGKTGEQKALVGLETPAAHLGSWHSITRNTSTRIWPGMSSAEKYRSNLDWFWPEDRGCRVRNESGALRFRIDQAHDGLRMLLWLRSDENNQCDYVISCEDERDEGVLSPNESRWVWIDLPASKSPREYEISCTALTQPDGGLPTYFVRGFFLHRHGEQSDFRALTDALALNRLDTLDAFKDPSNGGLYA